MNVIKNFFLHKVVLRVSYIIGAYAASHLVSVVTQPEIQVCLAKTGLHVVVTDPQLLQTWITGILLIAGEFIYHQLHKKVILPIVRPKT